MDARRAAPTVGIVACLAVVAVVAYPFVLVEDAAGVGTYYAAGTLTPYAVGLLALLGVVVYAAGREGRTDPATAAGAGVVFGVVATLVALVWALTVPIEIPLQLTEAVPLVAGLDTGDLLEAHRWLLVATSLAVVVAGGWYARALELL